MRGKTANSRGFPIVCIACVCSLMTLLAFACKHKTGDRISKLKRISAFTVDEKLLANFVRGQ